MTLPHKQIATLLHDSSEAIELSNKDLADLTFTDKTGSRQTTPFAGTQTQSFYTRDPQKRWVRNPEGTWVNEARTTSHGDTTSFSQAMPDPSQEDGHGA